MKYEKSCGAVIFRYNGGTAEYLIILNKKGKAKGHWGFPKGHVEADENEHQTAVREIFEETGITVDFIDGFRMVTKYSPMQGVMKDVVYFLAKSVSDDILIQDTEVADFMWCNFDTAEKKLTFDNLLLKSADEFLKKQYFL